MRPSCPQIYSSPCLDLIFSALLEIQPKLSRNAVIYLNSARNPGQFWSTWGYLSLATCQCWQPSSRERFLLSLPSQVQRHSQGAQGCPCRVCTEMCFGAAPCSSVPAMPCHAMPWGMVTGAREQSRAQHTPPEGPTAQESSCPPPAPTANKEMA